MSITFSKNVNEKYKHTSLGGSKVCKVPDELSNEVLIHGPVEHLVVLLQEGHLEIFCELKRRTKNKKQKTTNNNKHLCNIYINILRCNNNNELKKKIWSYAYHKGRVVVKPWYCVSAILAHQDWHIVFLKPLLNILFEL